MTSTPQYRPAGWLRELVRLHPARWPWRLSLRAALCVGAPLAIGLAAEQYIAAMFWVAMGALNTAVGEGTGTYRSRFRLMAISGPIAVLGLMAGYLGALPYPAVIGAMTLAAFLAGIVNSYGAAFSIGTMQALLLASIAIGLPEIAPFWQPAALYLVGAAAYAAVLGVEALIDGRSPERQMLAEHLAALAALAETRFGAAAAEAETPGVEAARRRATDASAALYAALLEKRRGGRTREALNLAATLDAADLTFSAIIAENDPEALRAASAALKALAGAAQRRGAPAAADPDAAGLLARRVARLAAAIGGEGAAPEPGPGPDARPGFSLSRLVDRLIVGRAVLSAASALALCMGLAFAAKYLLPPDHWYWVPLTVALVMKPDLGSVFARAVLRSLGTFLGVGIGVALLILLPKGMGLVAAIALLTALLPWAKLVSYVAQAVFLTPLVLILIDLITAATEIVDYGLLRLVNTAIGSAIVLIFGYFLWPRRHGRRIAADFAAAMAGIADYLVAASAPLGADPAARDAARRRDIAARRACYGALSNLRAALARSMTEPPPAGREAAAWFPIVADAERLCDRITAHAAGRRPGDAGPPADQVAAVASRLRDLVDGTAPATPLRPDDAFLEAVAEAAAQLADKLGEERPSPGSARQRGG